MLCRAGMLKVAVQLTVGRAVTLTELRLYSLVGKLVYEQGFLVLSVTNWLGPS
jgi:hypothetical protein